MRFPTGRYFILCFLGTQQTNRECLTFEMRPVPRSTAGTVRRICQPSLPLLMYLCVTVLFMYMRTNIHSEGMHTHLNKEKGYIICMWPVKGRCTVDSPLEWWRMARMDGKVVTIPASVLAIDQRHCFFANAYYDPSHFLASRLNGYNRRRLSITITLSTRNSGLYTLHANCRDARASVRDIIYSVSLKHTYLSVSNSAEMPCQHPHHQQQQSLVYSSVVYGRRYSHR